ncbi:MAG: riboflavin biosynthesis protein [marine bacterium B5-7]|nr:MAG: riboflavin biosynthesis protein [marine bacterium B5-7]
MKIIHHPSAVPHAHVATIGNFDGMHRGHQALIQRTKELASQHHCAAMVILFEPQPREYFSPDTAPPRVMQLRDKLHFLQQAGIDTVVCLSFSHCCQLSAETFCDVILKQALQVHTLVIGEDFRFGKGRTGDAALLQTHGLAVENIPPVLAGDLRISSTAVRITLAQADFSLAERLLGHAWQFRGRVAHGQQLGRTLGYPTLNIRLGQPHVPVTGIFAVRVSIGDKTVWGAASLGPRPVVDDARGLLEVHCLDFNETLYGQHVTVTILQKLRDIMDFDSHTALIEQMQQDILQVRALIP